MKRLIAASFAVLSTVAAAAGPAPFSDPFLPVGDAIHVVTATRTIVGMGCRLEFVFSGQPQLSGRGVARCTFQRSVERKYSPVESTGLVVAAIGSQGFNDCYLQRVDVLSGSDEGVTLELACADEN